MSTSRAVILAIATTVPVLASVPFSGQVYFQPTIGVDTITFSNIVLGSPLLITRLDLTIGNGLNTVNGTRSLFFDLPGGPAGFGTANAYAATGNGLVTGIQTVDAPGDGLADRTLGITFTSWVAGGTFTISLDVDRLGAANTNFSQGTGGSNCNNCDNINGQDFIEGGAISFRLWLASADTGKIVPLPNYVDVGAAQWTRTSSNDAVVTWSTLVPVEDAPPPDGDPSEVPEPGTFVLVGIGIAGASIRALRRKRR